ncbi:MAG: YceI family protein [Bacteroidota bacterium]
MYLSSPFSVNLLVIIMTGIVLPAVAPAQIYFDTQEESRLWLEGSSTVHRFDCVAKSIEGTAYIEEVEDEKTSIAEMDGKDKEVEASGPYAGTKSPSIRSEFNAEREESQKAGPGGLQKSEFDRDTLESGNLHVKLEIPIKSFDCGRSRMNRDMYEALKSDTYEYITFEFEDAETIEKDGSVPDRLFDNGYQPYRIEGVLNVAGVYRNVTLLVRGRNESQGHYHIEGQKEISMQDFDIEPPTALRGLIRAHDDLTVFFDLHVRHVTSDD